MGWGVGDGATFEALTEKRLNEEAAGTPYAKYEILNFGVPGHQPPQQLVVLDKALGFEPRAVLYVATGRELTRANRYLVDAVNKRIDIPYAPLREVMAKAGIVPGMDATAALKRLEPYRSEILDFTYRHIAQESRRHGAVPVWIFLPQVQAGSWQEETPDALRIAEVAGFIMIDLSDVFKGQDIAALRLAEWDEHPSERGHVVIASRLFAALRANQDAIFGNARP
jgi:hypothetical protein